MWAPDYIELEDLADYLGVGDSVDDAVLALAITTASRAVDDHTNRQFGKVDAAEARVFEASADYGRGLWVADIDDVQTLDDLVVEVAGVTVSTYTLEPRNAAQRDRPWTRITFTSGAEATPRAAPHEVDVTAVWGWTEVPAVVRQATLLQASRLVKRRDAPFGIAGSPELGSELRLLAKLDPDVAVSLRGLGRPRTVG